MASQEETVQAHEKEIGKLYAATERLAEGQERLTVSIDKIGKEVYRISEFMLKQGIILEKLTSTNEKIDREADARKDGDTRLHKRADEAIAESKKRHQELLEKYDKIENYLLYEGCPAHKSFIIGDTMVKDKLSASIENIDKKIDGSVNSLKSDMLELSKRVKTIEDTPKTALGKIGNAVLAVFGASIGGWLLLKFGFNNG